MDAAKEDEQAFSAIVMSEAILYGYYGRVWSTQITVQRHQTVQAL